MVCECVYYVHSYTHTYSSSQNSSLFCCTKQKGDDMKNKMNDDTKVQKGTKNKH